MTSWTGIPFKDHGRDRGGCDCWGLVRLYLMHEAGLREIPSYSETSAEDMAAVGHDTRHEVVSGRWRSVDRTDLRRFDVVQMWAYGEHHGRQTKALQHVGVMVDEHRVLHVEEGTASVIVAVDHAIIRSRLAKFWRHRDRADAR